MSTEQKPVPASINMDARNFLRAINNSAQSKVLFFESVVSRLGKEAKRDFKLVALQPTGLMFEDVATHEYYAGDIKKDGPRYQVDNIKKINIVEEKKADLFDKNCVDLVDAITEGDFKSADKTFVKIESQRFRSRVIPESGVITTRDGEVRHINIQPTGVAEDKIAQIVEAFTNAIKDSVEMSNGQVVRGTFTETGDIWVSPVDEATRRRIVARKMRQVAEGAHHSESFQKFVANIAGLVCQKKIAEAVEVAAKFLHEQQEFCLLDKGGMNQLVESALASQMEFNSHLVNDVTTLMYKTNLKVNRESILECWSKTAQKAQSAEWLTKVKTLGESKDFGAEYDAFLSSVLKEGNDMDTTRAKAYSISLKVIKNVLSHVEGQEKLAGDIDNVLASLSGDQPDTAMIHQTEELLASIDPAIVDKIQNLENFDRMPGVDDDVEPEAETGMGDEEAVPLPDLGDEAPADEFGGQDTGGMGDMGGMPAGGDELVPAGAGAPGVGAGFPEGKAAAKKVVTENFAPIEKMTSLELSEELLSWKTNGHIYLREDGFSDCFSQLSRMIDRAGTLGDSSLREAFESVRDVMTDSGDDVMVDLPVDPYAGKVQLKEGAKISADYAPVNEDLGGLSGPEKGVKHGSDASGMSELQGEGGHGDKSMKKADGRDSAGTPSASGAEDSGDLRMNKENQGKTKGLGDKEAKKVSGQDAAGTPSASGAAKGDPDMAKDFQNKTKSLAEDTFVDKIAQALDEDDQKLGVTHKSGAGYKKAHDLDMDELQGGDGVEDDGVKKVSGQDASGTPSASGAEKGDADMAKDLQDKTDGLAEDEINESDVVQEVPADGEEATAEDQRKGPRRHVWGKKKAAMAPLEVKKEDVAKGAAVKEDVAVFYSTDERMDEVIAQVVSSMKGNDAGAGAPPMDMPPMPEAGMEMDVEVEPMPPVDMAPEADAPEADAEESKPPFEKAEDDGGDDDSDDKKEESFDKTLGGKLSSLKEEMCKTCDKSKCECCSKCKGKCNGKCE